MLSRLIQSADVRRKTATAAMEALREKSDAKVSRGDCDTARTEAVERAVLASEKASENQIAKLTKSQQANDTANETTIAQLRADTIPLQEERDRLRAELAALEKQVAAAGKEFKSRRPETEKLQEQWENSLTFGDLGSWAPSEGLVAHFKMDGNLENEKVKAKGDKIIDGQPAFAVGRGGPTVAASLPQACGSCGDPRGAGACSMN